MSHLQIYVELTTGTGLRARAWARSSSKLQLKQTGC